MINAKIVPKLKDILIKIRKILNHPYAFILPYIIMFTLVILIPIVISALLSLTRYNSIGFPTWVGFANFVDLLTNDSTFLTKAISNTFIYAVIVGIGGYLLSFFFAWLLSQVTPKMRVFYTLCIYSPSITGAVMMDVVWRSLFSGDQSGYINFILIKLNITGEPIQFLQNPQFLFPILIVVGLWSSAGLGFLAMLAGLLNVDKTLYEAAMIDGIKNRWQEIFYITIPAMKPQMLFGAVMAVLGAFNISGLASSLSGEQVPPDYAGWMIIDHANDFGFTRYEMGYASAVTVILFVIVVIFNRISYKLFKSDD
jgi:multiple sugar transport system permease protein